MEKNNQQKDSKRKQLEKIMVQAKKVKKKAAKPTGPTRAVKVYEALKSKSSFGKGLSELTFTNGLEIIIPELPWEVLVVQLAKELRMVHF